MNINNVNNLINSQLVKTQNKEADKAKSISEQDFGLSETLTQNTGINGDGYVNPAEIASRVTGSMEILENDSKSILDIMKDIAHEVVDEVGGTAD